MRKSSKIFLLIFITIFSFNIQVNAVEVNFSSTNWENGNIDKIIDGVNSNIHLLEFWLKDGRAAFCLEYGEDAAKGETPLISIEEYFKKGLTETEAKQLVKKINKYLYFGYGSENMISQKYYIATQKLIWEAISKSGFYASDYYSENVKKYDFQKLEFQYEKTGEKIDLTKEINDIENAIRIYETKPSLCTNEKDELELDVEKVYTDENNVLSQYKVTCSDGLSCKIDNNSLKVTATAEGKDKKITLFKEKSGTETQMYKNNNSQGIVIAEGSVDAMSCDIPIDTFKKPNTSDTNIMLILITGLVAGFMAYITYNSSHKQEI